MKKLPPVHPGEVLLEDFMKPLGLSQYRVAGGLICALLSLSWNSSQAPVQKVTVSV